ncbi:MAG: hypothetical protein COZ34_00910 [Candidatus Pacebacteria bacterium CG_4_10_14_3_um_filter_34_15]|nr:hypothetical protein [Candidatus Pacearchaeota archaeon]NCQ65222.1 hypothetical protein [Candidatus Paceibacterota bacterium]OIO45051.1 MAG: hypothetical protein AUJ41_01295 [Candidatus Pacebacteria bacterium CG1_02_43_31]PIQ81001.1 MAG: hypothetical protein COV78_02265 [Candidatus Pacebacteria bacterium CG11_big_fil_rev_8_21_14_0_20_34_55]PIX81818.1 MAG: hypothetical protein COZ34_00910 [Candidatus Pacebacteria bacterium CG_4_10_14_3_um_filter_34_15]
MKESISDLQTSINELEKSVSFLGEQIRKQNSYRRNVSLSVVRGFSTAVGATVIFGVILALLVKTISSIDYVPIINNLMSSEAIESFIAKFTQP